MCQSNELHQCTLVGSKKTKQNQLFYCWVISHILLLPGSKDQMSDNTEEGCEINTVSFVKVQHEEDFLNSNSVRCASSEV